MFVDKSLPAPLVESFHICGSALPVSFIQTKSGSKPKPVIAWVALVPVYRTVLKFSLGIGGISSSCKSLQLPPS